MGFKTATKKNHQFCLFAAPFSINKYITCGFSNGIIPSCNQTFNSNIWSCLFTGLLQDPSYQRKLSCFSHNLFMPLLFGGMYTCELLLSRIKHKKSKVSPEKIWWTPWELIKNCNQCFVAENSVLIVIMLFLSAVVSMKINRRHHFQSNLPTCSLRHLLFTQCHPDKPRNWPPMP